MNYISMIVAFSLLGAPCLLAKEQTLLARVTVYWHGEGQQRACSNGARLKNRHCAVDPKRIPYGSRVVFEDGPCLAVDSGPAVVSRKAARLAGRTQLQRAAVVIDRYFETRKEALAWADAHPHFMNVQVIPPASSLFRENAHALTDIAKADPSLPNKSNCLIPPAQVSELNSAFSWFLAFFPPLDSQPPFLKTLRE